MKARILLAFLLFFSIFSTAQIQDLAQLANGELVFQTILREGDNKLFGYFFLYERNISTDSVTMEYVLLDKNLNKALNGTFNEIKLKSKYIRSYHNCYLMSKSLIIRKDYLSKQSGSDDRRFMFLTFQTIDLDSNKISKEIEYSINGFVNMEDRFEQKLEIYKKNVTSAYKIDVLRSDSLCGFLVNKKNYSDEDSTSSNNFYYYDENFNLKWTYVFKQQKESFTIGNYELLHIQGNNVYLGNVIYTNSQLSSYSILALDLVSEKKIFEYEFDNQDLKYERSVNLGEVDGQLNIIGSYTKRKTFISGYDFTKSLGFYQIQLDSLGNEIMSKSYPWSNFNQHFTLNEEGYDKQKFKLMPRQYFMMKDGSISILTEQFKPFYKGLLKERKPCTDDFVLMNFDHDMNLVRLDTISKEMSKNNITDYHFSEYIHDREGVVIFYVNSFKADKKEQVMLGINTVLNGTITEEKIPLYSKKEFAIYPMPAKEGYVMLREVNEKKKHNQIRLEKLNYDAL